MSTRVRGTVVTGMPFHFVCFRLPAAGSPRSHALHVPLGRGRDLGRGGRPLVDTEEVAPPPVRSRTAPSPQARTAAM